MCTLAVYRRVSPLYPLIVAANRDEFLGRASAPPAVWKESPVILAGRDLVAGGTWLGCRTDGSARIVGLLNRRPAVDRPASGPGERSRGLLCAETLAAESIDAALAGLDAAEAAKYGGFNLFVADLERALVVDNGDGVRRVPLETGLSVLTNLDVNDPRCPRLASATRLFEAVRPLLEAAADVDAALPALASVLASHEDDPMTAKASAALLPQLPNAPDASFVERSAAFGRVCVHVGEYGTRSSSILFVRADGSVRYFHAEGSPCTTGFREIGLAAC